MNNNESSYAEQIRKKIYGEECSENTVNAAIYARTSTNNLGQRESCNNQVAYAMHYINQHPNIKLKKIFVDEGKSGKNNDNRQDYQEMLQMIQQGEIQVVIIKDYSRANRSSNSFELEEFLVDNDATFINLANGQIDDLEDPDSELTRQIQYILDSKFVKDQSRKGRMTHQLRCKNKILTAKDCAYGYNWNKDTKTISVNEKEAEIVRKIFDMYTFFNGTPASIKKYLEEEGIDICGRTVSNIIQDERYIGNFYINKRTTKLGTGHKKTKHYKLPKEEWILCERPDLQIVDSDIFNMAQRVHHTRITVYEKPDKPSIQARFQGTHKYAGKVFCPLCYKAYQFGYADRKKTQAIYRIKNHADCKNPVRRIFENDLEEITKQALKSILVNQNELFTNIEKILTEIVKTSQNNGEEIEKLKKLKISKEKQVDNLINQLSDGYFTDSSKKIIHDKVNKLTEEAECLSESIKNKENNKLDNSYVEKELELIKIGIEDLKNFTSIDRARVLNFIERINLLPDEDIEILLKSGQIIIAKQENRDLSNRCSVGKMSSQDVLNSHHGNTSPIENVGNNGKQERLHS